MSGSANTLGRGDGPRIWEGRVRRGKEGREKGGVGRVGRRRKREGRVRREKGK